MTTPVDPEKFAQWLSDEPASVGDALLMLSSALTHRGGIVEHGRFALDELADSVDEPTVTGVVRALFNSGGFRGDVDNYHAEANSLLDQVLKRRVGMPITLSAVVLEVGNRVGLTLSMVGMPGHVIVGTEDPAHFIDAFGGIEVNTKWVEKRLQSIFGPQATLEPAMLQSMSVVGTVNRVCNNLTRTWADDREGKMDRLLDLRSVIPASTADRRHLIDVATQRGRFDIAAKLREANNPDDPEVNALWARLN